VRELTTTIKYVNKLLSLRYNIIMKKYIAGITLVMVMMLVVAVVGLTLALSTASL